MATNQPRKLRRREVGKIRRASYWAARMEAAETPAAKAVVAWDHLRARIAVLPPDKRVAAWQSVVAALARINPDRGEPRHRTKQTNPAA